MVPVREKSGVTALLAASSLADDNAPDWPGTCCLDSINEQSPSRCVQKAPITLFAKKKLMPEIFPSLQ